MVVLLARASTSTIFVLFWQARIFVLPVFYGVIFERCIIVIEQVCYDCRIFLYYA